MNFCAHFNEIPKNIADKLDNAPLFYSEDYEKNTIARGQQMFYVWSECRILAARSKKELFLRAALLEAEPFAYENAECEDEKEFLNGAMDCLKQCGVQWTTTTNTARFQSYPKGAYTILSGNHIIDLTLSEEELWSKMHSKHRNTVRRGEKAGMELVLGGEELAEQYTPLSNETYARSGKGADSSNYYKMLVRHLENRSLISLISKEGELQAGGMFLYSKAAAYYLHGASIGRPEPGSTNFMLWSVVMEMKAKGVREFSFVGYHVGAEEGSKLDGIQKFKERFGGELESCYSFRYVQKPFFYKLYCLAMQIKAKKPFKKYKDAIDEQIESYPELNK